MFGMRRCDVMWCDEQIEPVKIRCVFLAVWLCKHTTCSCIRSVHVGVEVVSRFSSSSSFFLQHIRPALLCCLCFSGPTDHKPASKADIVSKLYFHLLLSYLEKHLLSQRQLHDVLLSKNHVVQTSSIIPAFFLLVPPTGRRIIQHNSSCTVQYCPLLVWSEVDGLGNTRLDGWRAWRSLLLLLRSPP